MIDQKSRCHSGILRWTCSLYAAVFAPVIFGPHKGLTTRSVSKVRLPAASFSAQMPSSLVCCLHALHVPRERSTTSSYSAHSLPCSL